MPHEVFLIRHGPTHVKRLIGHTDVDVDLSNHQRIDRIKATLPKHAMIVSSDLKRARLTADAISNGQSRLPHDPALREYNFGDWEDRAFDEMDQDNQDLLRVSYENPGDIKAPNGESWNDVERRVCDRIGHYLDSHPSLIVVAHMGVILAYLRAITGKPAYETLAQPIEPLSVSFFDNSKGSMQAKFVNKLF